MMAFFPSTLSGTSTRTPPLSRSLSGVLLLFPQVGANGCLVEAVALVQELGDILDIRGQQLVLNEILDALEVTQRSHVAPSSIGSWFLGEEGCPGAAFGRWWPSHLWRCAK